MTKVLLVDDEDQVRGVIALLLRHQGYEIIESGYGKDGYAKAVDEIPDIILLDLMMPVMDGFEVLDKLKATQETQEIPVIILTANIDPTSEKRCMNSGAIDYINKPWGPGELEDRIAMALGYRETPIVSTKGGQDPDDQPNFDVDGPDGDSPGEEDDGAGTPGKSVSRQAGPDQDPLNGPVYDKDDPVIHTAGRMMAFEQQLEGDLAFHLD